MIGVTGVGNGSSPVVASRPSARLSRKPPGPSSDRDAIEISAAARSVSQAMVGLLSRSAEETEVRAERVAQARELMEQGAHRVQAVVLQVASRLTKFIPESW